MPKHAFTGQIYQLPAKSKIADGSYVAINGPHDTFGVVLSSKIAEDGEYKGRYIHVTCGVKPRVFEKPVHQF